MRLDLTLIQITMIKSMLHDAFEDDERVMLDTIEGETDAFEMTRKLLDGMERDEGDMAVLSEQIAARQARKSRCDARIKTRREGIMAIMECAGVDKLQLAEATLSLREVPAKLAVNAPEAVPDEYTVPKPVPSMDLIKADFSPDDEELPNWLRVEPARPSLTVRRR